MGSHSPGPAKMGDCDQVIQSLRGKILQVPRKQKWMVKTGPEGVGIGLRPKPEDEEEEDYRYTCEPFNTEWTPMNSNLHLQAIKVQVHNPVPEQTLKSKLNDSHEDTMLLLDMVKEKKQKENQNKKKKKQEERNKQIKLSWL